MTFDLLHNVTRREKHLTCFLVFIHEHVLHLWTSNTRVWGTYNMNMWRIKTCQNSTRRVGDATLKNAVDGKQHVHFWCIKYKQNRVSSFVILISIIFVVVQLRRLTVWSVSPAERWWIYLCEGGDLKLWCTGSTDMLRTTAGRVQESLHVTRHTPPMQHADMKAWRNTTRHKLTDVHHTGLKIGAFLRQNVQHTNSQLAAGFIIYLINNPHGSAASPTQTNTDAALKHRLSPENPQITQSMNVTVWGGQEDSSSYKHVFLFYSVVVSFLCANLPLLLLFITLLL